MKSNLTFLDKTKKIYSPCLVSVSHLAYFVVFFVVVVVAGGGGGG